MQRDYSQRTVCRNVNIKLNSRQIITLLTHVSSHTQHQCCTNKKKSLTVCDKINITMSYAGTIWANCLDKVSNVEQLDVLNGPVMTAEHVGHMDGPHWDLTVGKGPNSLTSSEGENDQMNEGRAQSRELQHKPDLIPFVLRQKGLYRWRCEVWDCLPLCLAICMSERQVDIRVDRVETTDR